jgi:hypothetical protein
MDMRRRPALLAMAVTLALSGGVAGASSAAAAPSPRSVQNYCVGGESAHPGNHNGWSTDSLERRNVGGTCPAT